MAPLAAEEVALDSDDDEGFLTSLFTLILAVGGSTGSYYALLHVSVEISSFWGRDETF